MHLLLAFAPILVIVICIIGFICYVKSRKDDDEPLIPDDQITNRQRQHQTNPLSKELTRRRTNRSNISTDQSMTDSRYQEDDDSDGVSENVPKIGKKKAAKLEMKAEKRVAREMMLREREEKKQEQERLDQIRKEEEEKLRREEEEREEKERLEREEQARKEQEAYLAMAASFEVDEEGLEEETDTEYQLTQFINYINEQKVVLLEQLAAHFQMKTKDVVDRIQNLLSNGSLVGLIDDRGKFISITPDELASVSKFIRQRGRVTVDELVVNSNKLLNLKVA